MQTLLYSPVLKQQGANCRSADGTVCEPNGDSTENDTRLLQLGHAFPRQSASGGGGQPAKLLRPTNLKPASNSGGVHLQRLPAVQGRAPCQTAAKAAHQQHVARFDPSGLLGFIEADRNRAR